MKAELLKTQYEAIDKEPDNDTKDVAKNLSTVLVASASLVNSGCAGDEDIILDIEAIRKVVHCLASLKKTEDIREDERDLLNKALIPLRILLLMQPPVKT